MTDETFRGEDSKFSAKSTELSPQRRKELALQTKLGKLALLEQILKQTELDNEEGQKLFQIGQQFDRPPGTGKISGLVELTRKEKLKSKTENEEINK